MTKSSRSGTIAQLVDALRTDASLSPALREAYCLQALMPHLFDAIQPGDLFAGRTHYLPAFSRLGAYPRAMLEEVAWALFLIMSGALWLAPKAAAEAGEAGAWRPKNRPQTSARGTARRRVGAVRRARARRLATRAANLKKLSFLLPACI